MLFQKKRRQDPEARNVFILPGNFIECLTTRAARIWPRSSRWWQAWRGPHGGDHDATFERSRWLVRPIGAADLLGQHGDKKGRAGLVGIDLADERLDLPDRLPAWLRRHRRGGAHPATAAARAGLRRRENMWCYELPRTYAEETVMRPVVDGAGYSIACWKRCRCGAVAD